MPTETGSARPDLLGNDAVDLLEAALGTAGGRLRAHAVDAVHHRPGGGLSVGYRLEVVGDDGTPVHQYLVLSTDRPRGLDLASPGLVVLDDGDVRVLAWRFPDDPALPGLATACDPSRVASVLPSPAAVTSVELLSYRPLRRAVVRVQQGPETAYVKVLRTRAGAGGAADVVARHRLLLDAGLPVPQVLRAAGDGIVVLAAVPGIPLAEAAWSDDHRGMVAQVVGVLDRLPSEVLGLPPRPAWADRAGEFASVLVGTPWEERARRVAAGVGHGSARVALGAVVPTHGDLHDGQVTVSAGPGARTIAGLVDVDTVGPGHRVDDLACLVGHAMTLGERGAAAAAGWRAEAGAFVDPTALTVRTAGVLLSLAAGALGATTAGTAPAHQDVDSLLAGAESLLA